MGSAVALVVPKLRQVRKGFIQSKQDVVYHIRVSIFVNRYTSRCMWAINHGDATYSSTFGHCTTDLRRNVVQVFLFGAKAVLEEHFGFHLSCFPGFYPNECGFQELAFVTKP